MVQQRNVVVCILLVFVTCGIYWFIWQYQISKDTRALSGDTNGSAGTDLLLEIVTCGLFGIYMTYRAAKRMYQVEIDSGNANATDESTLLTIIHIFTGIVSLAMLQSQINRHVT